MSALSRRLFASSLLAGLSAVALLAPAQVQAADKPKIVVSIAMLGEPVARILGDAAEVETLLGPGVDPHLYSPTRSDVAKAVRADDIVLLGLNLEAQMLRSFERLDSEDRRLHRAGQVIAQPDLLTDEEGVTDPHLWMDPDLWVQVVSGTIGALVERHPELKDTAEPALADWVAEAESLESQMFEALQTIPQERRVLVTAHDAFGYFGEHYAFAVEGIQGISTESEAGLRRVSDLVDMLVDLKIPAVFAESSVSERGLKALMEGAESRGHTVGLGGTLYSDAMGEPGTVEATWLGMAAHNAATVTTALGGEMPTDGFDWPSKSVGEGE
ncbi:MAG: zinc ABC transporter substrate-binding protein [Alphaproteobacteria bacterium]